MPGGVYILCAATSFLCAVMLLRGYRHSGTRLLFWSALCFLGLTIENAVLYVDVIVIPDVDLTYARLLPGLAALLLLIYGLIWDAP